MKATEQYFPVVLFIVLYKVALIFESIDKILKSYESYWVERPCHLVQYNRQHHLNFWVRVWNQN